VPVFVTSNDAVTFPDLATLCALRWRFETENVV
jgi:hypothetical protein